MRRLWDWLSGWYCTWRIKRTNPGLYEFLKNYKYNPDDFEEVPGVPGLRIHKDALENMRKLGEEDHG